MTQAAGKKDEKPLGRLTLANVKDAPAVCSPHEWATMTERNLRSVQADCQSGRLPATKYGGRYYINVAAALALLGVASE